MSEAMLTTPPLLAGPGTLEGWGALGPGASALNYRFSGWDSRASYLGAVLGLGPERQIQQVWRGIRIYIPDQGCCCWGGTCLENQGSRENRPAVHRLCWGIRLGGREGRALLLLIYPPPYVYARLKPTRIIFVPIFKVLKENEQVMHGVNGNYVVNLMSMYYVPTVCRAKS